jgi:shikimate dehydrogenase
MTTRVALLGDPVGHSRSPVMQNAAFEALGLDWRYEAIAVPAERFTPLLRSLREHGFVGANVTIPHKLRALEAADQATEVAAAVGAANTLLIGPEAIVADNTDVEGFLGALRERAPEAPGGMRALVLGAGGAARAVVYALVREGAAAVLVWNRSPERAQSLVEELGAGADIPVRAVSRPDPGEADLLVNATSVGMAASDAAARERDDFKQLRIYADKWGDVRVVVDMVYGDRDTELSREARARGKTLVEGIDILAHQGAASFQLWTGRQAPLQVMRIAAGKQ